MSQAGPVWTPPSLVGSGLATRPSWPNWLERFGGLNQLVEVAYLGFVELALRPLGGLVLLLLHPGDFFLPLLE